LIDYGNTLQQKQSNKGGIKEKVVAVMASAQTSINFKR
jgi:hypothetical protein